MPLQRYAATSQPAVLLVSRVFKTSPPRLTTRSPSRRPDTTSTKPPAATPNSTRRAAYSPLPIDTNATFSRPTSKMADSGATSTRRASLTSIAACGNFDPRLHGPVGAIDLAAHVRDLADKGAAGVGLDRDGRLLAGLQSGQVVLEDRRHHPNAVEVDHDQRIVVAAIDHRADGELAFHQRPVDRRGQRKLRQCAPALGPVQMFEIARREKETQRLARGLELCEGGVARRASIEDVLQGNDLFRVQVFFALEILLGDAFE